MDIVDVKAQVTVSAGSRTGDLYVFEYILNLKDAAVASAYNALFDKRFITMPVRTVISHFESRGIKSDFVANFSQLDSLAHEQQLKHSLPENRSVRLYSKGDVEFVRNFASVNISLRIFDNSLFGIENSTHTLVQDVDYVDESGASKQFKILTWSHIDETSFFFDFLKKIERQDFDLILTKDHSTQQTLPAGLSFRVLKDDKKENFFEYAGVRESLFRMLPESLHEKFITPVAETQVSKSLRDDTSMSLTVFLQPKAWDLISGLDQATVHVVLQDMLDKFDRFGAYGGYRLHAGVAAGDPDAASFMKRFYREVPLLKQILPRMLLKSSNLKAEQRLELLLSLQNIDLAKYILPGLLTRLLVVELPKTGVKDAEIQSAIGVVLRSYASKESEVRIEYGAVEHSQVFLQLQALRDILTGLDFDISKLNL